jgi:hypothetical protein
MPRPRRDGTPARAPNKRRLSDAFVKTVRADPARAIVYWDTLQRGLALTVQPSGHRAWKCVYSIRGHGRGARWYHLGDARAIALADARRLAGRIMYQVAEGGDPHANRLALCGRERERCDIIATKFLSFIERGIEPTCYLYRHFDPNGELLYVGVSLHALNRQNQHFKEAEWQKSIYQIVIEPFETREQGLAAEELAIRTEFPKFNSTHNKRRHPYQELARVALATGTGSSETDAAEVSRKVRPNARYRKEFARLRQGW